MISGQSVIQTISNHLSFLGNHLLHPITHQLFSYTTRFYLQKKKLWFFHTVLPLSTPKKRLHQRAVSRSSLRRQHRHLLRRHAERLDAGLYRATRGASTETERRSGENGSKPRCFCVLLCFFHIFPYFSMRSFLGMHHFSDQFFVRCCL